MIDLLFGNTKTYAAGLVQGAASTLICVLMFWLTS
jgi:hypothetical protein